MTGYLYKTLHPDIYHGHGKKPPFFEGWYYKLVSADETERFAIIPGVILGEQGHAFVQVLDGSSGNSSYHVYPLEKFWSSEENFLIRIGENEFAGDHVRLNIDDQDSRISGELNFEGITPWPVSWRFPGIMGWYAWVPKMECYHGVVSLDHDIQGELKINESHLDFDKGRGYIEKDWGKSFPEAWVWFQSNHFKVPGICITASVAIIPWLWSAFKGFIIGFLFEGNLYRFATYTGAKSRVLEVDDDQVRWVIEDDQHQLILRANQGKGGLLRGPTRLDMGKRVVETLDARVQVELRKRSGDMIFSGEGQHAGLEVQGDLERLLSL